MEAGRCESGERVAAGERRIGGEIERLVALDNWEGKPGKLRGAAGGLGY